MGRISKMDRLTGLGKAGLGVVVLCVVVSVMGKALGNVAELQVNSAEYRAKWIDH